MKLEKLNRLFTAYNTDAPSNPAKKIEEEKAAALQLEEAVKVAQDFGSYAGDGTDKARFDRIKAEVQSGTYKVDSKEVAKSLLRDIFG